MLRVGSGNRGEWEFEYTASKLAMGAAEQRAFRLSRVAAWTETRDKLMAEIRSTGIEINESAGATMGNYANTSMDAPSITINPGLQKKLNECHAKIQAHTQAAAEYDGWIQVLSANPESRQKLTQADWLYFFGKV